MASGQVVIFASTPNDAETSKTLNELTVGGSVSHIVALDAVHALYLSEYAKAYPQAKIVGPKGLVSKKKDLNFDIVLPDAPLDAELEKEFRAIPMTGHPNEDIVWYHKPTKSLIQADVLFNLPSKEQAAFSIIPGFMLAQMSPGATFHRLAASAFSMGNPKAFAEAAQEIASLDMRRIIPCHGDVIEGSGAANEAWRQAYGKFLGADSKAN